MDAIFSDYLDLLAEADSATQTYNNNHRSFELFSEYLAEMSLDAKAVRLGDLRDWLKLLIQDYKASTVARHATCVRAAYKHAHELGVIDHNPTSGIQKLLPRSVDKLPEVLTAEQLRACHRHIETEREMIVFHLLLWTGCRAAELRPLRWEPWEGSYVDFANQQFVILGKGAKIRFVPMHPIVQEKLEQWQNLNTGRCVVESGHHREMSHQTWTTEITRILDRAGVHTEKKSHVFRKTLNTNLVRQKVPEHVLDALFGWAPATVRTKHYSGVARDEVREGLLKAYSDDPVVPEQRTGVVEDALIAHLQAEIERLHQLKQVA